MSVSGEGRVPVLSRVGDALERVVFADWYRWVVRGLLLVVGVVAIVHLLRYATGVPSLTPGGAELLTVVTSIVLAVFVLTGAVQLVLYARGVRRREAMVASTAEQVEASAEVVEEAAEDLEAVAADPDAVDPETVEEQAREAEETASEAKETAESVQEELAQPADSERDAGSDS